MAQVDLDSGFKMLLLNKAVVDHRTGAELLLILESSLLLGEFCCRFNLVQAVLPETLGK